MTVEAHAWMFGLPLACALVVRLADRFIAVMAGQPGYWALSVWLVRKQAKPTRPR